MPRTNKQIATEIRRILKDAGYMVRVERGFLAERIGVGRDQIVAALDHVETKTFRVLRARGQEGSVAWA